MSIILVVLITFFMAISTIVLFSMAEQEPIFAGIGLVTMGLGIGLFIWICRAGSTEGEIISTEQAVLSTVKQNGISKQVAIFDEQIYDMTSRKGQIYPEGTIIERQKLASRTKGIEFHSNTIKIVVHLPKE